jgi:hypothetical protein
VVEDVCVCEAVVATAAGRTLSPMFALLGVWVRCAVLSLPGVPSSQFPVPGNQCSNPPGFVPTNSMRRTARLRNTRAASWGILETRRASNTKRFSAVGRRKGYQRRVASEIHVQAFATGRESEGGGRAEAGIADSKRSSKLARPLSWRVSCSCFPRSVLRRQCSEKAHSIAYHGQEARHGRLV